MRAFMAGAVLALVVAAPASAQTQFGFNTTQVAPNYAATCASGIPTLRYGVQVAGAPPFAIGSQGFPSCTWSTVGTTSSLLAPGTGTVTSVQLPPLQNPGPMQVVVLRFTRINGANAGLPTVACCQAVAFSPVFTPQPGQATNLQTNLPVGVGPATSTPGESQTGDAIGLSILSPNAQLPVVDTGDDNSPFGAYIWLPALNGSTQEFVSPNTTPGYILEMSATWMGASTPTGNVGDGANNGTGGGGGNGGGGGGVNVTTPAGGLRFITTPAVPGSGLANLGTAANPPTASTRQTLTFLQPAGKLSAARKTKKVAVGSGTTKIADGGTGKITAKLNATGKKLLKQKGKLKVTVTIVAKNSAGAAQTVTKTITLKRKK